MPCVAWNDRWWKKISIWKDLDLTMKLLFIILHYLLYHLLYCLSYYLSYYLSYCLLYDLSYCLLYYLSDCLLYHLSYCLFYYLKYKLTFGFIEILQGYITLAVVFLLAIFYFIWSIRFHFLYITITLLITRLYHICRNPDNPLFRRPPDKYFRIRY